MNKFWEFAPSNKHEKFDFEDFPGLLETKEQLTALGNQTSGHEETWNTQDNPLWQALRQAGEAYRIKNRIYEKRVPPTVIRIKRNG